MASIVFADADTADTADPAPASGAPDRDMPLTYTRAAEGGWNVHRFGDAAVLGRVFRLRAGRNWWTEMSGEGVMQLSEKTRVAAARRIPACLHTRWLSAEENRPAAVPAGFEVVDIEQLGAGDEVLIPQRVLPDGVIKSWDPQVRTVRDLEYPRSERGAVVVLFVQDEANSNCWPWIGGGPRNRLARRAAQASAD